MDLQTILLPEKVVSFEYPGCDGLIFDLAFLAKDEVVKLQKSCTNKKMDSRTRTAIDHFDEERFLELYVKKIIRGWKGFKVKFVREMVLIDDTDLTDDEEVPYTPETALILMKASTTLDSWVSEQIGDLGKFTTVKSPKKLKESVSTLKQVAKE